MPQQNVTVYVSNLPQFSIIMWYGASNAVPTGWSLCDGRNGTPNLADKFIVGAGNFYGRGDTGGAAAVTLTTDQIPSHSHTLSMDSNWQVPNAGNSHNVMSPSTSSWATSSTGGGNSHENRPPYYALYYIMKIT